MRSSGRRLATLPLALLAAAACEDEPAAPAGPPAQEVRRFAAVAPAPAGGAEARFCERTFPASGESARPYQAPPIREVLGAPAAAGDPAATPAAGAPPRSWRWLNLWATWCAPCLEEMALLATWKAALAKDGVLLDLTLLSVDTPEAEAALRAAVAKGLPGPTSWLRAPADLDPFLASLGVEAGAALPIHALVDKDDRIRCVRVGAIHDRDYGAVRALLTGG